MPALYYIILKTLGFGVRCTRDVREILSNLIGYLEDWELVKTEKSRTMEMFNYKILLLISKEKMKKIS